MGIQDFAIIFLKCCNLILRSKPNRKQNCPENIPPFTLLLGTVTCAEKLVSSDYNVVFPSIFGITRNPD